MEKYEFIEIESIELEEEEYYVYDLTVEDDESYIANDYIVHNCITSSNTSIHYPMASLIEEIFKIKLHFAHEKGIPIQELPKIVADGGIRNYSDVIKALALGADYVMIGSVFAQLIESSAKTYTINKEDEFVFYNPLGDDKILEQDGIFFIENEKKYVGKLFKIFYGMASKEGQLDLYGFKHKTSEGIVKTLPCTTNVSKWSKNMIDYLRSTMSYTNINSIYMLNQVEMILISDKTYDSINK